ncbi:MAG: hypothetical protein E6G94_07490 [Alphaproteobacteria bacterium]|nr:MAG: hypothetical protein E6G94_07490 [Alphaproteobacteria bacterium]
MKKSLIILALVGGCGASDRDSANAVQGNVASATPVEASSSPLAGLYQSGSDDRPNQLCILPKAGKDQFALLVWGSNMKSCSGAGTVTKQGDSLRLQMTGDSQCTFDAKLEGGKIVMPDTLPSGCSYYCAEGAHLTGATLTRIGGPDAARKAKDFVGEPLCD